MVKISFYLNDNAPDKISKRGVSYGYFEFEYLIWRKLLDFYKEINPEGAKELLELTFSCMDDDYDEDDSNGGCVPYSTDELREKLLLIFELRDAVAANKDVRFWSETPWVDPNDDDQHEYDIESDMGQEQLLWVLRSIIIIFENSIETKLPFTVYPDLHN